MPREDTAERHASLYEATAPTLSFRLGICVGLHLIEPAIGAEWAMTLQRSLDEQSPALLEHIRKKLIAVAVRDADAGIVLNAAPFATQKARA